MTIEFHPEFNKEAIPKIITIDIDENEPIEELLSKLCEYVGIERYVEMTWEDNKEKLPRICFYKNEADAYSFAGIHDLQKKISDFPKYGNSDTLSICIDTKGGSDGYYIN
jgi:hypothetical protein